MVLSFTKDQLDQTAKILHNQSEPLKKRFRALFALKNVAVQQNSSLPYIITLISECFSDPSDLLKHECAYCLGQIQSDIALPILSGLLSDFSQNEMVRHEAGEAIGAIGLKVSSDLLEKFSHDNSIAVAETCQIALSRIHCIKSPSNKTNPYNSIDPAPPCDELNSEKLEKILLNDSVSLFDRYRAMFSLRNIGDVNAVNILTKGLKCSSALFRHEIAFVLGQMQHSASVDALIHNLRDLNENPMVRHECAEALGAIATEKCREILEQFVHDNEIIVRESCIVALDISEYENSNEFQYTNSTHS